MNNQISYGSVCSGIEAASVAWHPLGWRPAWFAEIEAFPSAVLAHRFPHVTNLGDMTAIAAGVRDGTIEAPDILVGGTPCQAFSVAGARAGLADPRGQLTLSYVDLANAIDSNRSVRGLLPVVALWENVPGVLSSKDNAFGCFLGALAGEDCELEPAPRPAAGKSGRNWRWDKVAGQHVPSWPDAGCVYGPERTIAWRVIDAQFFGLAQRRRRVFVVSSARDGFDPAAILLEFDGVRRDSAPVREAGKGSATGTLRSTDGGCDVDHACAGHLVPADGIACMAHGQGGAEIAFDRSPTLTCNHEVPIISYAFQPRIARNGRVDMGDIVNALTAQAGETGTGDAAPCVAIYYPHCDVLPTMRSGGTNASAFHGQVSGDTRDEYVVPCCITGSITHTLKADGFDGSEDGAGRGQPIVADTAWSVRRIMPVEAERLQGFPDNWTLIPWRKKLAADGPRYKALGNSMAVSCMAWIGQRIAGALA